MLPRERHGNFGNFFESAHTGRMVLKLGISIIPTKSVPLTVKVDIVLSRRDSGVASWGFGIKEIKVSVQFFICFCELMILIRQIATVKIENTSKVMPKNVQIF